MIYHLSSNPKYNWCVASKEYLAWEIGISRRQVINLLSILIDKGLIIKDESTNFVKTTELWYQEVIVYDGEKSSRRVKKVHTDSEIISQDVWKKFTGDGEIISHNNNIYNNKDNNIDIIEVETKKVSPTIKKWEKFLSMMKEYLKDLDTYKKDFSLSNEQIQENLKLFFWYWTEKSPNGKKERWEKETTFDINLRFYKWLHNQKNWEKPAIRGSGITSLFDE